MKAIKKTSDLAELVHWARHRVYFEVDIRGGVKIWDGETNELLRKDHTLHKGLTHVKNYWKNIQDWILVK